MSRPTETVSFRMDQEILKIVDKRRKAFGDSRGEFLKRIAIRVLLKHDHTEMNDQILLVREAVDRLEDQQELQNHELTGHLRRLSFVLLSSLAEMSSHDIEVTIKRIFKSQDRSEQ